MALIKCPECGREISDKSKACIHCGYPLELEMDKDIIYVKCPECENEVPNNVDYCPNCGCPIEIQKRENINNIFGELIKEHRPERLSKKIMPLIVILAVVAIICIVIYNVNVVQPRKLESQNEATYEEAIGLLEKGKYEDGNNLLQTISGYKDVDAILEQIKWESMVYECITDIRQYLKNPDSLQVYEVVFYDGYKSDLDEAKKKVMEDLVKLGDGKPICVMRRGGQNGFGGNTTGYSLFYCVDGTYEYVGSCDSLDEDKIDEDDDEELAICGLINLYKDNLETVGDVDLTRIRTIIKNDSYSTIKIIE